MFIWLDVFLAMFWYKGFCFVSVLSFGLFIGWFVRSSVGWVVGQVRSFSLFAMEQFFGAIATTKAHPVEL